MANCLTCIHREVCKERMELFNLPNIACQYEAHELIGEWVKNDDGTYSCSVCQSWIPNYTNNIARYCWYCGAKMVERGLRVKMGLIDDAIDGKLDLEYFKIGNTIYTQDNDKQGWTGREG